MIQKSCFWINLFGLVNFWINFSQVMSNFCVNFNFNFQSTTLLHIPWPHSRTQKSFFSTAHHNKCCCTQPVALDLGCRAGPTSPAPSGSGRSLSAASAGGCGSGTTFPAPSGSGRSLSAASAGGCSPGTTPSAPSGSGRSLSAASAGGCRAGPTTTAPSGSGRSLSAASAGGCPAGPTPSAPSGSGRSLSAASAGGWRSGTTTLALSGCQRRLPAACAGWSAPRQAAGSAEPAASWATWRGRRGTQRRWPTASTHSVPTTGGAAPVAAAARLSRWSSAPSASGRPCRKRSDSTSRPYWNGTKKNAR